MVAGCDGRRLRTAVAAAGHTGFAVAVHADRSERSAEAPMAVDQVAEGAAQNCLARRNSAAAAAAETLAAVGVVAYAVAVVVVGGYHTCCTGAG